MDRYDERERPFAFDEILIKVGEARKLHSIGAQRFVAGLRTPLL